MKMGILASESAKEQRIVRYECRPSSRLEGAARKN
jgi:hypothetical protein